MQRVNIRPLNIADAKKSWLWRNDPNVWAFTGSKPNKFITEEMEMEWIKGVLARKNERRFAICIGDSVNEYVGNVQLTDITKRQAEFHIFIGEKEYWGKGIATLATNQILEVAFKELFLSSIYLYVKKENIAAIKVYQKCGFKICSVDEISYKMEIINAK